MPRARRTLLGRVVRELRVAADSRSSEHVAISRRKRRERIDSVDATTLAEREQHLHRIAEAEIDPRVLAEVRRLHLGRTKLWQDQKRADQRRRSIADQQEARTVLLGRTGIGMHHDWDRLNREGLPEMALLGHSNCGKSAVLNALAGAHARKGPAAVSSRAGWTADLGFYRMRPKSAKTLHAAAKGVELGADDTAEGHSRAAGSLGLVLVDTPGYGFAVGDKQQLHAWGALLADYLDHAPRLRLALMLVDATRGLCRADTHVLRRVQRGGLPVLCVLTKADLLAPEELAASHAIVSSQLAAAAPQGMGVRSPPLMLSAHFMTGVSHMWRVVQRTLADIEEARRHSSQSDDSAKL